MLKQKIRTVCVIFLFACVGLTALAAGFASAKHLIFRQYLRTAGKLVVDAALTYALIQLKNRIPKEKRAARVSAAVLIGIAFCLTLTAQFLFETDRESVAVIDGQLKIKVERSFFLLYDVTYYEYENAFWYKAFPRAEENYDDGDPDDWIYTDYYDETGAFAGRVWVEEQDGSEQ